MLSFAIVGIYKPLWSEAILDELEYHEGQKLIKRGLDTSQANERAKRLCLQMRTHFSGALVAGTDYDCPAIGLPDPDDEHVVRAAVLGQAGVIVTENIKDFPAALMPEGVEVKSAREFMADAVGINPELALDAIFELSSRYINPRLEVLQILENLEHRYRASEAVEILRDALHWRMNNSR